MLAWLSGFGERVWVLGAGALVQDRGVPSEGVSERFNMGVLKTASREFPSW